MLKKTLFLLSVVSFFLISGCERDEDLTPAAAAATPQPDTIVHLDITDISLISNYTGHPSGCGQIPTPSDTLMVDSLDLDQDGSYDIRFENKHEYNVVSASSPCVNYNCHVTAGMLHPTDTLAMHPVDLWWINMLNENDTINSSVSFNGLPGAYLFINTRDHIFLGPYSFHNFVGDTYMAFKLNHSGKTMYGWIKIESLPFNGVIIKEFAINKTNGNSIACGQY